MTRPIAFIDAHVVDPTQELDQQRTVLIEDGCIKALEYHVAPSLLEADYEIIDCRGKYLIPGLIDMQVRTGEPGNEHEETLASASLAAAAGGITTMITMPDTKPIIDDVALVEFIHRNARETAVTKVQTMGALTKGLDGIEMAEMRLMHDAGAVAFTNAGTSVKNSQLMRRALSYSRDFGGLIVHHVEDASLTRGGVMNEGEMASRLGLPGIPKTAEIIMLERDIRLAELTGGRYHAASISCVESLECIRQAKAKGLNVTCGVSINNVSLNENDVGPYRTFFKLSPPLRHEEDRLAVIDGIRDRTIDVIHSDHTPHDVDMKRHPFEDASNGAVGLETLLAACLRLVHDEAISMFDAVRVLSSRPASLLSLTTGTLKRGAPADLTLVNYDEPWILTEETLVSKSKNTAFEGAKFTGRVFATFVNGQEVYRQN